MSLEFNSSGWNCTNTSWIPSNLTIADFTLDDLLFWNCTNSTSSVVSSESKKSLLFLAGIAFSVLGTLASGSGKMTMRFSHMMRERGRTCFHWILLGVSLLFIVGVGPGCDIVSYIYASQSILSPFAAMTIVWTALFAPCSLGEKLQKQDILGMLLVISGVIISSLTGNQDEQDVKYEDIVRNANKPGFWAFMIVNHSLMFSFFGIMFYTRNVRFKIQEPGQPVRYLVEDKFDPDKEYDAKQRADILFEQRWRNSLLRRVAFCSAGGTMGGNQFMAKCFSSVISNKFQPPGPSSGIALFAGVVSGTEIFLLNKAMARYEATTVIPMYQSILIVFGSISAAAFWGDWDNFEVWQFVVFPIALVVVIIGIIVLVTKPQRASSDAANDKKKSTGEVELEKASDGNEKSELSSSASSTATSSAPSSPQKDDTGLSHRGQFHDSSQEQYDDEVPSFSAQPPFTSIEFTLEG